MWLNFRPVYCSDDAELTFKTTRSCARCSLANMLLDVRLPVLLIDGKVHKKINFQFFNFKMGYFNCDLVIMGTFFQKIYLCTLQTGRVGLVVI
jgi:hypothetical protein